MPWWKPVFWFLMKNLVRAADRRLSQKRERRQKEGKRDRARLKREAWSYAKRRALTGDDGPTGEEAESLGDLMHGSE